MDLIKRNRIVDELLLIMKQKLDEEPRIPYFDFKFQGTGEYQGRDIFINPEGQCLTKLKEKIAVSNDEFKVILKYCYSQKYIIGAQQYLRITNKGIERGNEAEKRLINIMIEEQRNIEETRTKFSSTERKFLEKFLGMETGYVLSFSNRTFADFFMDNYNISIYDDKYNYGSGSKANRLRAFLDKEPNELVADSIIKLIEW